MLECIHIESLYMSKNSVKIPAQKWINKLLNHLDKQLLSDFFLCPERNEECLSGIIDQVLAQKCSSKFFRIANAIIKLSTHI